MPLQSNKHPSPFKKDLEAFNNKQADIGNPTLPVRPPVSLEDVKAERIARSVALNCASQVTEAFASVFHATDDCKLYTDDKIRGLLKSIKQAEFYDNLKLLGVEVKDEEIPF